MKVTNLDAYLNDMDSFTRIRKKKITENDYIRDKLTRKTKGKSKSKRKRDNVLNHFLEENF